MTTYIDLLWYLIVGGLLVFGLREVRILMVQRVKAHAQVVKSQSGAGSFAGISAFIENIEPILGESYKLRDEMIKAGANEQALAPINFRIRMMERVKDHKPWLRYIAPHLDGIAGETLIAVKNGIKRIGSSIR